MCILSTSSCALHVHCSGGWGAELQSKPFLWSMRAISCDGLPAFCWPNRDKKVSFFSTVKTTYKLMLRKIIIKKMHRFLLLFWVYLSVLQRPQVQQVNITGQRCTERLERAELGQLAASRGHHGERRVAQGEWGQVSEQREMFNGGSTDFLLWKHTKRAICPKSLMFVCTV